MPHSFRSVFTTTLAGALALFAATATAQNKTAQWLTTNFEARTHYSTPVSDSMKYRLFVPVGYDPAQKYPIVIALHGIGERGFNNVNQVTLEELAQPWVRDSVQAKHPHLVMVPQCPSMLNGQQAYWWPSQTWQGTRSKPNIMVMEALDSLKREFSLDTTRFYVAGLSMGGFGTIELMKWHPDVFAAAVPTAGGGDTAASAILALSKTPFWAFHGAADPTVSAERGSRTIVSKVEALTGTPFVRFTSNRNLANSTTITVDSLRKAVYQDSADYLYSEVINGNHGDGWFEAWRHPMLTDWVFSKRKGGVTTSLADAASRGARPLAPANIRVVFRDGRTMLEKTVAGRTALFTLEGKKVGEGHPQIQ